MRLRAHLQSLARLGRGWLRLGPRSRRNAALFEGVEAYCTFVGHPRSGHTIVGALLDGHPETLIGFETHAAQLVWARFGRDRTFQMILDSVEAQGEGRWVSGEYSYRVPELSQGRVERLRVIGDNQAEGTTLRIAAAPGILDRTRRLAPALRVLHVVRDPLDNITTMARRARGRRAGDLRHAAERYFHLCDTVTWIRGALAPGEIRTVHHGDFVANAAAELGGICQWLDLEADESYLSACAGIVYSSPHRSRDKLPWPADLEGEVRARAARYAFLERYAD